MQPRLLMAVGFFFGGVSMLAFGWPGMRLTPAWTMAIAIGWGLSMGFGKATFAVCPAMFYGRRHLGSIQGLLQTTNVASTAIGPLIIGVAHDACHRYSPILLSIAAINIFIGALGALLLRTPQRRDAARAVSLELPSTEHAGLQLPANDAPGPDSTSSTAVTIQP